MQSSKQMVIVSLRRSLPNVASFIAILSLGIAPVFADTSSEKEAEESRLAEWVLSANYCDDFSLVYEYLTDLPQGYDEGKVFEAKRLTKLRDDGRKAVKKSVQCFADDHQFEDYDFKKQQFVLDIGKVIDFPRIKGIPTSKEYLSPLVIKVKESEAEQWETANKDVRVLVNYSPIGVKDTRNPVCFSSPSDCTRRGLAIKVLGVRITTGDGNVLVERGKITKLPSVKDSGSEE